LVKVCAFNACAGQARRRTERAMILTWICFYDVIIAVVAIAAGIAAAHFELIAPFSGFQLMLAGLAFAALGLVCGLIAVPMTLFSAKRRPARGRALISTFVCVGLLVPIIRG